MLLKKLFLGIQPAQMPARQNRSGGIRVGSRNSRFQTKSLNDFNEIPYPVYITLVNVRV